jgi:F0F1-type ATP synthase assembly protein I
MPSDPEDKPNPDLPPPAKQVKSFSQQYAMAMELPFILVGTIVVGGGIGFFLDRWMHTTPALMLVLGGLGFAVGIRDVLRRLPKD